MNSCEPLTKQPSVPGAVISIHDVRPGNRMVVERMLCDLAQRGARHVSLLIIPNWHRCDFAFSDPSFCAWLLQMRECGHELILHGYYHERVSTRRLTPAESLIARHYTAGEGEFFDVDMETARNLIAKGLCEWEAAFGTAPAGFIAPAWLLGRESLKALRTFPFEYTTLLTGVLDLQHNVFFPSRSLVYSVRAAWRRICSLAWNSLLMRRIKRCPLVRLGLHPPDWEHSTIRAHALQMASRMLAKRPAITYHEWLTSTRASAPR